MKNAGKIVIADDVRPNLDLLVTVLTRDGYSVQTAPDGVDALELVVREMPDLVVSDVLMPRLNGFDLCRRIKENPATRLIPVVLVTSLDDRKDRLEGINAGADDFLRKPFDTSELKARVRSLVRMKRFTDDLDSAEAVILSLALTIEARDAYTSGHCQRMASYAAGFGLHLDLAGEDIAALHRGGYLHDVGKIGIPDAILLKPGPLSTDEFETLKRHTLIGESLCGNLRVLRPVRPIIRHHHERADGSGYPGGLQGNDIPLLAQIMGIVDVFDALTTDRVYRPAFDQDTAYGELRKEVDRGWRRADLVDEFIAIARSGRLAKLARDHAASMPADVVCQ